jgi:hypothetical protein
MEPLGAYVALQLYARLHNSSFVIILIRRRIPSMDLGNASGDVTLK